MSIYLEFPSIPDYPVYDPMKELVSYLSYWGVNCSVRLSREETIDEAEPDTMPAVDLPH